MSKFIERCHGSSAALPTPYAMGKVDFDALEAFCNRLIDRGLRPSCRAARPARRRS